MKGSKIRYHAVMAMIGWCIAFIIVMGTQWLGQRYEGYFFPVALAKNVHTEEVEDQLTLIYGSMDKYRNCTFLGVEAYLVDTLETRRVLAPLNVKESVKLRPVGDNFSWGPWTISLPLWQAQTKMQIETVHRCHWLWLTRTIFYDTTLNLAPSAMR